MLNNIKILDTIRYTNSKTTEFPYEISSQLEGFNNNVFYFKKHPNETYVENLFVKSLVDSSDKFNMQIILDSTLNALLKNNYEYKTAISIIDRMIINVKTESGSFGRRAGYYLFKYNPIFMLSAILTNILFRKETLKQKQAFDFSEGWINTKVNEFPKLNNLEIIEPKNEVSQFELAEIITEINIEAHTPNEVQTIDVPVFQKLKSPVPRKKMFILFKKYINCEIGIKDTELECFIDYCFYFDGENRYQFEIKKFSKPTCDAAFLFEFFNNFIKNSVKANLSKILSACFDKYSGFSESNLTNHIAKKHKYDNTREFESWLDVIKSKIPEKRQENKRC